MYRTYLDTDGDFSGTVILISVEGVILQLSLLYLVPFRHFVKFHYSCYFVISPVGVLNTFDCPVVH